MYLNIILIFAPLLSALIAGILHIISIYFNNKYDKTVNVISWMITTLFMFLAFMCSIFILQRAISTDNVINISLFNWFTSDNMYIYWVFNFDVLSCLMSVIITLISFFVYFYSLGYIGIKKNQNLAKFLSYLSFFSFFMILLVTSNNFIQLFLGWEGISLFSYFLIAFLYKNKNATLFANKSFIINRVSDFAFLIAIFITFNLFGTLDFPNIFSQLGSFQSQSVSIMGYSFNILEIISFLITIAAMGKSAQLFFQVWLPDAMEAPTPVSALLHAATMVTAGVFLISKLSPMISLANHTLEFIVVIGSITAFLGASIAIVQTNIKKIIAYSTVSQIGYMFIALGSNFYNGSMFHIFTHAFFKSCLFLCAGIVIHNMQEEQDITKMGGLWKKMPFVYIVMIIASLALDGIPPFAGYFSKDAILDQVFTLHSNGFYLLAYILGVISTLLTSFYSFKLIILVFHNRKEPQSKFHKHKSFTMTFTVVCLGIFSIFAGYKFSDNLIGDQAYMFWQKSLIYKEEASNIPIFFHYVSTILSSIGIIMAYIVYSGRYKINSSYFVNKFPTINKFLINKWYFDIIYNKIFVYSLNWCSKLFNFTDDKFLTPFIPNLLARIFYRISKFLNKIQTGYFYHYVFVTLIGVFVLVLLIMRF